MQAFGRKEHGLGVEHLRARSHSGLIHLIEILIILLLHVLPSRLHSCHHPHSSRHRDTCGYLPRPCPPTSPRARVLRGREAGNPRLRPRAGRGNARARRRPPGTRRGCATASPPRPPAATAAPLVGRGEGFVILPFPHLCPPSTASDSGLCVRACLAALRRGTLAVRKRPIFGGLAARIALVCFCGGRRSGGAGLDGGKAFAPLAVGL